MSLYVVLAIFIPALITFSLRALPFLLFSGDRKMPDWLSRLGAVLPSAITAVLIVYCLKGVKSDIIGTGILLCVIILLIPMSTPRLFGYDMYNVVSGSMEPTIPEGSVIYVEHTGAVIE